MSKFLDTSPQEISQRPSSGTLVLLGSDSPRRRRNRHRGPEIVLLAHFFPPAVGGAPTRNWSLFAAIREFDPRCKVITSDVLNRRAKFAHHGIGGYLFFVVYCWFELLRVSVTTSFRTLFVTVPPPTTSVFLIFAKALRKRVIVDIQDLWPEILVDVGYVRKGSFLYVVLRLLQRLNLSAADSITTVSPDLAKAIKSMTTKPVRVVQSQADPAQFTAVDDAEASRLRQRHNLNGKKVLLYIGALGRAQRFDRMISAMPAVATARPDALMLVVGSGDQVDSLRRMTHSLGISDHVRFIPPVPHTQVPAYMSIADVCLLPLDTTEVEALPTKFFEYLACGRPVLATSSIAVAKVLAESGAGVFIQDPTDSDGLARAITKMLSDDEARKSMGRRSREYAVRRYDLPDKVGEVLRPWDD